MRRPSSVPLPTDYSRPYNSQLPKGTTDCYVKTVYDTGNTGYSYYLFASGRRVYQKDAQLFGSEGFNANVLGTPAVKVSKSHTMADRQPSVADPLQRQAGAPEIQQRFADQPS